MEPSIQDHYDYIESQCPGMCKDIHNFMEDLWRRVHENLNQPEPEPESESYPQPEPEPESPKNACEESFVQSFLRILNLESKGAIMKLKGIGKNRANKIIELRGNHPMPFKTIHDLTLIGLTEIEIQDLLEKNSEA